MKIVQVVTYASVDGAYGGPVAVAIEQCRALAAAGHDVVLLAGHDGVRTPRVDPASLELFFVGQLPGLGFAGMYSCALRNALKQHAASADVVHLHFARDLVQGPASRQAARSNARVVLQPHGMVRPDSRIAARLVDHRWTLPALRRADSILALTQAEATGLVALAGSNLPIASVRNAVALPEERASWDGTSLPEIVYISRLHARKRPTAFVDMATELLSTGFRGRFTLYGPDEGEARAVRARIAASGHGESIRLLGPVEPTGVPQVLRMADAFVLPSINEPFPMAVLEAMAHGVPCLITDQTGLSEELAYRNSAVVTDGSPHSLARAVRNLFRSRSEWKSWADRARTDIEVWFNLDQLCASLVEIYEGKHPRTH